jgi:hypothetical protein
MAAGPETNLWKSMQRNLPQGCVATRLENRHGGGIPDVMLMWDGVITLIELKAPKALMKQVFDPAAPSLSELPKLIDKNYQSSSLKSTDFCGRIYSADILRPEQKAFAARACSCGAPVFILARPQKSNEIKLLSPVITNAALRLRAVAESPRWPEIFAALRLAAVRGP